jgi:hypothetical protein
MDLIVTQSTQEDRLHRFRDKGIQGDGTHTASDIKTLYANYMMPMETVGWNLVATVSTAFRLDLCRPFLGLRNTLAFTGPAPVGFITLVKGIPIKPPFVFLSATGVAF